MANKSEFKSVIYAVEWWVNVLKNGLIHPDFKGLDKIILQMRHSSLIPTEKKLKAFQKELTCVLCNELKKKNSVLLKTNEYPTDILQQCALNCGIFVKLINPFPEKVIMEVTKKSVLIKTPFQKYVLYSEKSCELEKN